MTLARVSFENLRELASTRPAPAGAGALRAALHTRRMLLVKTLLVRVEQHGELLPRTVRRCFERDWALLECAERTDAAAASDVVDYPMTGAWLAEALAAPDGPEFEAHLAHLGGVALAAAVRAGCRVGSTTFELPSDGLVLPGLGVLQSLSGRVRLHDQGGLVRITDGSGHTDAVLARGGPTAGRPAGGSGWSGLRVLPGSAVVLDDLHPFRVPSRGIGPEALPAADRVHTDHRIWAGRWREAHALLAAADPGRAEETTSVLRAVVPLAPSRHASGPPMSATLRAAPGAALTQLPADAKDLAEALVHETHHTKLTALHEIMPLYRAGDGVRYRVGWRPDPRPVPGVLQGTYAHLALTDLWWRARAGTTVPAPWRRWAELRFGIYWDQVGEALSILRESDELTFAGREFVQEMGRHHVSLGVAARHLG